MILFYSGGCIEVAGKKGKGCWVNEGKTNWKKCSEKDENSDEKSSKFAFENFVVALIFVLFIGCFCVGCCRVVHQRTFG